MSAPDAGPRVHRLQLSREQLLVAGGVLLVIGAVGMVLVPIGADGAPVEEVDRTIPGFALPLAVILVAFALLMRTYYRYAVPAIEGRVHAYAGDDAATVELTEAGAVVRAAGRTMWSDWTYVDEVVLDREGLELRRRGGPVAFYPATAFATPDAAIAVADDVRRWVAQARSLRP